jgi:predicted transcriptional regulator
VVRISKEDFQAAQGEQFIQETFDGSLPRFLAAFSRRQKLSLDEIDELRKLIDNFEEDGE